MSGHDILQGLTLLIYLAASLCFHAHLFAGLDGARRAALILVPIGVATHTAAIGAWCMSHTGILADPAMPYSLVAFFLAVIQAGANLNKRWSAVGSLTVPLAFIALSTAQVYQSAPGAEAASGSSLMRQHVLVLLFGFCALALAFCLAVIFQVQSRLLKTKHVGGVFSRLPPLDSVATGAHRLAVVGFSLLTLGVVTGTLAAPHTLGPTWYTSPRVLPGLVTSLIAWCIYAAYLGVSLGLGWRGRRTTYFLIAGFAVILAAFFASVGRHKGTRTARESGFIPAANPRYASRPEPDAAYWTDLRP